MSLTTIQQLIDDEFETYYQPAEEEDAIPQLFVLLRGEESEYILELAFVPLVQEELDNTKLLQFFVKLSHEITFSMLPRIKQLILQLNFSMPLVGFGYEENNNLLYFKYVTVLNEITDPRDIPVLKETIWLIYFELERCYPFFSKVIHGEDE